MKIDTKFLREYLALDREVKEKSKILSEKKAAIVKELKARKGKAIITRFYIAAFELATRTLYNIPIEIKNKYKEIKEYDQLKVTEKKRT